MPTRKLSSICLLQQQLVVVFAHSQINSNLIFKISKLLKLPLVNINETHETLLIIYCTSQLIMYLGIRKIGKIMDLRRIRTTLSRHRYRPDQILRWRVARRYLSSSKFRPVFLFTSYLHRHNYILHSIYPFTSSFLTKDSAA